MTEAEREAAKQRQEIARQEYLARDEYAKRVGMAITKVRNEALALLGVFTAGLGIKSFMGETIGTEASLERMSQNLDMSARDLATWQLAAKNAGGSIEGMTAQLQQSAASVASFKAGLGADSGMQFFFRMGGKVDDLKDGNSYLLARSKIVADIYKTDKQRAAVVAQQMGLDQAQFNLLKLGPEGIAQRRAEQEPLADQLAANSAGAEQLRRKYDSVMTVTVGAGGTGVAGGDGGNGGASSFGSLLTAPGGAGGTSPSAIAPPVISPNVSTNPASSGGNVINASGGVGAPGVATGLGAGASGTGGSSHLGGGGSSIGMIASAAQGGGIANSPGAGGSGATSLNSGTAPGGKGGDGAVIIWEYA